MYLKDFEPLLVVFGYFVCSHQLNAVAISRVADNVILHRESRFKYRKYKKSLNRTLVCRF